jgi:hypothetical protein
MGQAISLSGTDSSLLISNKDLLWKTMSKNGAKTEIQGIIGSLEKCPQNVTMAVNCNGVTKQKYDAEITKQAEAGCADTTVCKNAIKVREDVVTATAKKTCDDNKSASQTASKPVITGRSINVKEKDSSNNQTIAQMDKKVLKKDSSIILEFTSDKILTSANFKWNTQTGVECKSPDKKKWTCTATTASDVPNFDNTTNGVFTVTLDPPPADGVLDQDDWVVGTAGFDNIVSIPNLCDKKTKTYLFFLLLVTLALIMLNKDEVMKCVKKYKKMIC